MTQTGDKDPAYSASFFKRMSRREWTDISALRVHPRARR
jgi:hypothetical protein